MFCTGRHEHTKHVGSIQTHQLSIRWTPLVGPPPSHPRSTRNRRADSFDSHRKSPWRMSKTRKMRTRTRLAGVDDVILTLENSGIQTASLVRLLPLHFPEKTKQTANNRHTTLLSSPLPPYFLLSHLLVISHTPPRNQSKALALPTESEMPPRNKYTIFSRTSTGYRKGMHKVPHWTRLTLRENPVGF